MKLPKLTEKAFLATVTELARWMRWRVYHTHDSRRSEAGFPDLVLVRGSELIFAELKTDEGRVTAPQREWLNALHAAGAEAHIWRPADFELVERRLAPTMTPRRVIGKGA